MMLEVNDLVSGYGRIQVLNGISLKVYIKCSVYFELLFVNDFATILVAY